MPIMSRKIRLAAGIGRSHLHLLACAAPPGLLVPSAGGGGPPSRGRPTVSGSGGPSQLCARTTLTSRRCLLHARERTIAFETCVFALRGGVWERERPAEAGNLVGWRKWSKYCCRLPQRCMGSSWSDGEIEKPSSQGAQSERAASLCAPHMRRNLPLPGAAGGDGGAGGAVDARGGGCGAPRARGGASASGSRGASSAASPASAG